MYYNIVPMDRSHVDQIAQLERENFSIPWSETQLEDALYNDAASFIVAEDEEGNVIGYAGLNVVLDEGYINNIVVEEAARRHGVASALLEVYCRFAAVKILQRILCAFVDAAQMEHCAVIRRILPTEDLQKSIALRRTVILRCAPYIQLRRRLGERIEIL